MIFFIGIASIILYYLYENRKTIIIETLTYYSNLVHFLENSKFINQFKSISNSIKYYDIENNKYISLSEITNKSKGFVEIYHNGSTKYIDFRNLEKVDLNDINFKTPNLFSSVVLNINELKTIECENIINKFVLPDTILYLDDTTAKIIYKISNTPLNKYQTIFWNVITKNAKIYCGFKLIFTIENNYNLRK